MKTDYALRVLFTLVEHYGGKPISIRELAACNGVPRRFLEHIMLEMKSQGWVDSVMGKDGGYVLSRSPEQITAGEVVRHFTGVLAPIGCVSVRRPQRCKQEDVCKFRWLFLEVRNSVARRMDNATLGEIFRGAVGSNAGLSGSEFVDGAGI